MNDLAAWLWAAFGVLAIGIWLVAIVGVIGLLAFAGRRRAMRRGTIPLHLLPWYLGGTPEIKVDLPAGTRSRRKGAGRP